MVKDVKQNVDVFENDIDKYLQLFCEEQDIADLRAVPLTIWNAALMYVCKHVFKNTKVLKTTETQKIIRIITTHVQDLKNLHVMHTTLKKYVR